MSAELVDLDKARASRDMDPRRRQTYATAAEALRDARQLLTEITLEPVLLVPVSDLEFTLRRVRALINGSIDALEAGR